MASIFRFQSDFQYIECDYNATPIGEGTFAQVFSGIRKAHKGSRQWDEIKVAVKRLTLKDTTESRRDFMREIEVMCRVQHRACLPIIAWTFESPSFYFLASPLLDTDLSVFVSKAHKGISDVTVTNEMRSIIALGVAEGLRYLHSQNIVHGDIKPANVLLDAARRPQIGDFGLSKLLVGGRSTPEAGGTLAYTSPERLESRTLDRPVDVFSYGVLLYELYTSDSMYPLNLLAEQVAMMIRKRQFPSLERKGLRPPIVDLIQRCWGPAGQRPTFEQIVGHKDDLKLDDAEYPDFDQYLEDVRKPLKET
jgi:serine/threonine protein kinase